MAQAEATRSAETKIRQGIEEEEERRGEGEGEGGRLAAARRR